MTWTLVVTSHGRWHYLDKAIESIEDRIGLDFFARRILSLDGCYRDYGRDWEIVHSPAREGLAATVNRAWDRLDGGWVFHTEEDFILLDAPVKAMKAALKRNPHVANMVLLRQPWGSDQSAGGPIRANPGAYTPRDGWLEHREGYWLNPHVFRAEDVARDGWPDGNEAEMTRRLLDRGRSFGYWGAKDDDPRCVHIGVDGGMGSEGWLP